MSSISPAKLNPISWICLHYSYYSFCKDFAQVYCCRQISIRFPQRVSKRLPIYQLRLWLSTVFFSLRRVSFTRQERYLRPFSPVPPKEAVAATAYYAYFSSKALNSNLRRVTCDFDSLEFIARYWLSVRIRRDAHMMPEMAAENAMIRPRQVAGKQSPQPIVPMVTIMHQTKSSQARKLLFFAQARLSIREKTTTSETQRTVRQAKG